MFTQSLRHSKAVPPPFAQGRLMKEVETYSKLSPSGKGDCRELPQNDCREVPQKTKGSLYIKVTAAKFPKN